MPELIRYRTDGEALRMCSGCAWLGNGRKDAGKCKRRRVEGDWLPIWAVPKCDVRKDKNIDQ